MARESKIQNLKSKIAAILLVSVLRAWLSRQACDPPRLRKRYQAPPNESSGTIHFVDITQQAGINFVHNTGAFGKKYLAGDHGAGLRVHRLRQRRLSGHPADQWQRLSRPQDPSARTLKLYHNNGNGTFTDVTAKAGLDVEMYGMGVAVGDYDNDGWDDIYITGLGEAHLFHNEHNGTFKDVTKTGGREQHRLWRQRRLGGL